MLIANTSPRAGRARVTLVFEDATTTARVFKLRASSRTSVATGVEFPSSRGRRFGVLVEAIGDDPVQVVVERAVYTSPGGVPWAAGSNALATRLR